MVSAGKASSVPKAAAEMGDRDHGSGQVALSSSCLKLFAKLSLKDGFSFYIWTDKNFLSLNSDSFFAEQF